MLINEIINLLDVDELRNLVCHQRDLIDCLNEELYCKNRELDTLLYTYDNCRCGILDHENRIRQRQELDHVEDILFEKYYSKIPHNIPTCDSQEVAE